MRRYVFAGLVAFGFLAALKASAGEVFLGEFTMDAGSSDNLEPADGGGFVLPARARISVMCSADSYVCVDRRVCTAQVGIPVSASQLLPTSTNEQVTFKGTALADGGCYPGPCVATSDGGTAVTTLRSGIVSAIPVTLGTNTRCVVWSRFGNEGVP